MNQLIRTSIKTVVLLCCILLCFSLATIDKAEALSPQVLAISQAKLQKLAQEKNIVCPQGTTLDLEESSDTKVVCDVDSDPNPDNATDLDVYPLSSAKVQVARESELPKLVNKSYPEWYRGHGEGYLADEDSHHVYYNLLGPGTAIETDGIYCSSFYLKPGKTYIGHNHPSREFYYVVSGEAKWYAGKDTFEARPGDFIVHPPYLNHGLTNTSKTEELRAFSCWWQTSEDAEDSMNYGGLPTNPCLSAQESTAKGYAVDSICLNE